MGSVKSLILNLYFISLIFLSSNKGNKDLSDFCQPQSCKPYNQTSLVCHRHFLLTCSFLHNWTGSLEGFQIEIMIPKKILFCPIFCILSLSNKSIIVNLFTSHFYPFTFSSSILIFSLTQPNIEYLPFDSVKPIKNQNGECYLQIA